MRGSFIFFFALALFAVVAAKKPVGLCRDGTPPTAHETDCNKFYICVKKLRFLAECPGNWLFNPAKERCVSPLFFSCGDPTHKPCGRPPKINCPSPAEQNWNPQRPAVFFTHETDCRQYYQCDWGVAHLRSCPSGLHFNRALNVCDWPANANCACKSA